MAYIEIDDLKNLGIKQEDINTFIVTTESEEADNQTYNLNAFNAYVKQVEDIFRSYLSKYDIESELSRTGDDRNFQLLGIGIVILVYKATFNSNLASDVRKFKARYDVAIKELEDIKSGRQSIALEVITVTTYANGQDEDNSFYNNIDLYKN